jgi:hypothetical protein
VPDDASRMTAAAFPRALARGPALRGLMQAYAGTMLGQITQSAACIQRHLLGQRCARWLLMAHDRVGEDHFTLTQAFLGQTLGVQRATASPAAQGLHTLRLIRYVRGQVTVTDRAGLEAAAYGKKPRVTRDDPPHLERSDTKALMRDETDNTDAETRAAAEKAEADERLALLSQGPKGPQTL